MNIGQASAVVDVIHALHGEHVDPERLDAAVRLLAAGAGKALQISPDTILRGKR